MVRNAATMKLIIPRSEQDRRTSGYAVSPYLTDEGIVMVDRREGAERRKEQAAAQAPMRQKR